MTLRRNLLGPAPAALGIVAVLLFYPLVHSKAISITPITGLDFGTAAQGDPAKTVPPGTSETGSNASFRVRGDDNRAYTIILPNSATLTTGIGGAGRTITYNSFTSFPTGSGGLLNNNGEQMLYVGATRSALSMTQVSGTYTGSFLITVVY